MKENHRLVITIMLLAVGFGAAWIYGLLGVGILLGVIVASMTMDASGPDSMVRALLYYFVAAMALAIGAIIWTARSLSFSFMSVIVSNLETLLVGAVFVVIAYALTGHLRASKVVKAVA